MKYIDTLNSAWTFDNFIESKCNQLAIQSGKQVADNIGKSYNPFLIYGASGLGKTHLMHAIGNRIREINSNSKVVCVSAEYFVNDMITALRTNEIDQFKKHYRGVDALLVDDIQFFTGKNRSLEEFFHTFNSLLETEKQVILTTDQYPHNFENIDSRMTSRFAWGLSVEIESPDLETRINIIHKKAELYHLKIPNNVASFISKNFKLSIRDLESALLYMQAHMQLSQNKNITLDAVKKLFKNRIREGKEDNDSIERTIEFPSEYHSSGISILQNFGKLLRNKYADTPVRVSIIQEGLSVKMIITPPDGKKIEVEEFLTQYGLVVKGELLPEELLQDSHQILELKTELMMAKTRIEMQREQMLLVNNQHSSKINSLEDQVSWLRTQIGNGLATQNDSLKLLAKVFKDSNKSTQKLTNNLIKALKNNNKAEVKKAALELETKNPEEYSRLKDFINNVGANAPSWIEFLSNILPK